MNYQGPWQQESAEALEINVLGLPVAWTVDDDVYVRTGETTEREDGYIHIGTFEWEDGHSESFSEQQLRNSDRLHEYVCAWIKTEWPEYIEMLVHYHQK